MIEGELLADTAELFLTKLYGITEGVWTDQHNTLYTVGNLMYRYRNGEWSYVESLQGNVLGGNPNNLYRGYLHAVRGNASNDMLIVGELNTLRHFNGVTWMEVGPPYRPLQFEGGRNFSADASSIKQPKG